ncbi:MAG: ShlB/FhaC/HecB family hemolysin secretion/activation protein [Vicinamibacterales bacterium]
MVRPSSLCVASLLVLAHVSDARGQQKPPVAQPGQIERQFQRPPEPSAKPGAITIPEAGQKPPENADSVKIVLNNLTVDGVKAYRPDALRATYANLLQKEVTLADIYRIVETLTARYRNDGYILSQVFVPAQTVEDGAVRLQAIEGYIANVRVEGGSAALQRRVQKYGDKIKAARPLTMAALERYVLLVNDLPGVVAHAVLAPSSVPGASDLVLQVSRRVAAIDLSSDNRGARSQGPARTSADLNLRSLVGVASSTELRTVTSFNKELTYLALSHNQFIGAEGGNLSLAASYVYSQPKELSVVPLNLTTWSGTASVSYTQPILRRRSHNLYLHGGLSAFNSTTTVFGINDTIDRVRSVSLGLTYDGADGLGGVNVVDLAFSQGLTGLGASRAGAELLSRATGRADFRKTTLYAQRLQSLGGKWSLLFGLNGQYAATDLLASEMFSVGGELFGRGYDPSALLNDHGAAAKLDLRYSQTWGGRRPISLMPYVFGDAGRVWQRTPLPGLASSESLASAGGGIRLSVGTLLSGFVEVGKPFNTIVGQDTSRNARVYAGVSVR